MDRQDGRTGLAEAIYIPDGPVNHEMDVQRQLGNPGNGLDHRHANGQIRDKETVHDVYMNVICAGPGDGPKISLQVDKIRREDGGGHHSHDKAS